MDALYRSIPQPDDEVVPNVKWGLSGWIFSPAYWKAIAAHEAENSDYICRDERPLHHELGFCLIGGYGVRMEMNQVAWEAVRDAGLLEPGRRPASDEVENVLSRSMTVEGRKVRYRFPRQRSERIANALAHIEDSPPQTHGTDAFRADLLKVPGIGPKTASWIARNWLGSEDVAIIDVHVARAGILMGLFPRDIRLPRDYAFLEDRFLQFASAIEVRPALLDAIMWREMRSA